jgi:cytochrome c-type biogenesis protein CcmH
VVAGSFWIYVETGAPGYPDVPLQARIAAAEDMRANRPTQKSSKVLGTDGADAPAGR